MSTEQLVSSPLMDKDAEGQPDPEIENSGFDVEVYDDTPEGLKKPSSNRSSQHEEELEDVGQAVKKRINKLKYQFHQEKRNKDAAVRMRDESVSYAKKVADENKQLRELVSHGERALIEQVQSKTENDVNSAKERLKRAHEEGDADALVEAQEVLAKASYDARKASEYGPVTQPATELEQPAEQPAEQVGRPVRSPEPKAAAWARKNPWFQKDREMTAIALAVHEELMTQGISPQSDEYFSNIDQRVRTRFPEKFARRKQASTEVAVENAEHRPAATQRRPPAVVAPAKRTTGAKRRKVKMSETQFALAKKLGVTPEEYAIQVIALEDSNG